MQILELILSVEHIFYLCNSVQPKGCVSAFGRGFSSEPVASAKKATFPITDRYLEMRDELGFCQDEDFARCFSTHGQPGKAPWRLALILTMQFVEGLLDEQAAQVVAGRINWKYVLSLELTEARFDASVLSEFHDRLLAGEAEAQLLERMLVRIGEAGYVKARGRWRTDSTHVLAAVRAINHLVCADESLRFALNTLATVVPAWLNLADATGSEDCL